MKKIYKLIICTIVASLLFIPILGLALATYYVFDKYEEPTYIIEIAKECNYVKLPIVNDCNTQKKQAIDEIEYLLTVRTKEGWFKAYKEIIEKNREIRDIPETIYDCFPNEELDLLFRIVQAEVGDEWGFEEKVNVASVIFNRLYSEDDNFKEQDTLIKVLTTENQFSTYSNGEYKNVSISDLTISACEYAFMIEDTTDGCIAFRSDDDAPKIWCEKWKRVYRDKAGHWFYREIKENNE